MVAVRDRIERGKAITSKQQALLVQVAASKIGFAIDYANRAKAATYRPVIEAKRILHRQRPSAVAIGRDAVDCVHGCKLFVAVWVDQILFDDAADPALRRGTARRADSMAERVADVVANACRSGDGQQVVVCCACNVGDGDGLRANVQIKRHSAERSR